MKFFDYSGGGGGWIYFPSRLVIISNGLSGLYHLLRLF
jgi:hypothetical protein